MNQAELDLSFTELNAPISRVWLALTDHREFGTWFRVRLDGQFVPGQVSRGQITYPGYEHIRWEAIVQRMEPERLFSFTWHPYAIDPNEDYSGEPPTTKPAINRPPEMVSSIAYSSATRSGVP